MKTFQATFVSLVIGIASVRALVNIRTLANTSSRACLEANAIGKNLTVANCNGALQELWIAELPYQSGQIQAFVDPRFGGDAGSWGCINTVNFTDQPSFVQLSTCNNSSPAQQWIFFSDSEATIIQQLASEYCLAYINGTVRTEKCEDGGATVNWMVEANNRPVPLR